MTIAGRLTTKYYVNNSIKFGLSTFFIMRIWFFTLGALGILLTPIHTEMRQFNNPIYDEELNSTWFQRLLLSPNYRYDTVHYLEIARYGYRSDEHNSAYAPLFPALIWVVNRFIPSTTGSAILVASLAALISFVLLHFLITEHSDEQNAAHTLLWLCVFPSSLILFLPYTESLFFALMLGFFLAVDQKKYWIASLLAILATLARFTGVFLSLVLIWDAYEDCKFQRYTISSGKWLAKAGFAITPVLTFILYSVFLNQYLSGASPWDALRTGWDLRLGWPWEGIIGNIRELINIPFKIRHISILFDFLFALLIPVMLFRSRNFVPVKWLVFFWLIYISAIVKISDDGILTSTFRYGLTIFPVYMVLGRITKSRKAMFIGLSFSLLIQAMVYSMVFMWVWII